MRASDRLDAYFAARETDRPSSSALARADDVVESSARVRIRRAIELRLSGRDIHRGPRPRVSRDECAREEGDEEDRGATVVGEEARPRAERRADAVLRRLVDECRASTPRGADEGNEDEGGEDDETWTPSGIDWNATPSFLLVDDARARGARFVRETHPAVFEGTFETARDGGDE